MSVHPKTTGIQGLIIIPELSVSAIKSSSSSLASTFASAL